MADDRKKAELAEQDSITMPEMARLLGIRRENVYELLKSPRYGSMLDIIALNGRRRITKESFERFLADQKRYRLRSKTGITSVDNESAVQISNHRHLAAEKHDLRLNIGNSRYLTVDEAAALAGMSRTSISKYALQKQFPTVRHKNILRISRPEFESWLNIKG